MFRVLLQPYRQQGTTAVALQLAVGCHAAAQQSVRQAAVCAGVSARSCCASSAGAAFHGCGWCSDLDSVYQVATGLRPGQQHVQLSYVPCCSSGWVFCVHGVFVCVLHTSKLVAASQCRPARTALAACMLGWVGLLMLNHAEMHGVVESIVGELCVGECWQGACLGGLHPVCEVCQASHTLPLLCGHGHAARWGLHWSSTGRCWIGSWRVLFRCSGGLEHETACI